MGLVRCRADGFATRHAVRSDSAPAVASQRSPLLHEFANDEGDLVGGGV